MPERIQMSRQHPWRKDHPDAVIVARPSKWGNPIPVEGPNRWVAVEAFRGYVAGMQAAGDFVHGDATFGHDLSELRGRDLACWCPLDQPCHANVLLEIANG